LFWDMAGFWSILNTGLLGERYGTCTRSPDSYVDIGVGNF